MKRHNPDHAAHIRIIGAASGIGAQDRACADGPVAFHRSQAWHELEHHPRIDWGRTLFAPEGDGASTIARIAGLCRNLADEVGLALRSKEFPVVLGGDHSVAIGTWSGVARTLNEPVGLLWIDAHLDSHTPETSYSGAIHGMPLACLLGRGDKRLLNIGLAGRQVVAAHTVVLGPRSYEPEELEFLRGMQVRIIDSDEILHRGFADCLDEAIAIVASAPAGFGVTLDLDAIDPRLAPGVGSPEPDGLVVHDVVEAMRRIGGLPGLKALEIVEYNPDRDRHGATAGLISDLIGELLPPGM
ncbi:MAG: arginase [Gammaproteobacteria bacterium]|nr:arginase [Gammaproteobacteria bacterium]MBU2435915.1 arginase [Gammaproteobacteria bacterium]MBU2449304.1 arginase [Gammaproteobacteria bacterium]